MKEYKMVHLNKGLKLTRESDLNAATEKINEYVRDGWVLQEVVSPADHLGALIGVFYKERE